MKLKLINSFIIIILLVINSFSEEKQVSENELVIDNKFLYNFSRLHDLKKDNYLRKIINKRIIGKGYIQTVLEKKLYNRKYVITLISSEGTKRIKFIYHIYLNNEDTINLLTNNAFFEFKGQLAGFTALDTDRSKYVLDIIFEDGSTVIK